MSFCSFINGNLEFNQNEGAFGKVYVRFRGVKSRTVKALKKLTLDPNYNLSKTWSSCPATGNEIYLPDGDWGYCVIEDDGNSYQFRIRPEFDVLPCNGANNTINAFTNFAQIHLLSIPELKICQWEFHDGQGSYVDVIVVLEDNGGGGGCFL